ncbi:hypothetical protein [Streptomyces coffeae]|uniref:DUF1634 domain-containing protein n=1 Tax=Streptomyces coffeae TaxID=621382 RepID=A0ABS1NLR6_9ACTN|nr:hypothetical protein [Streptomyces coffeae]MBL1101013.1 hypothetical protein [Streptomyces coffeae]
MNDRRGWQVEAERDAAAYVAREGRPGAADIVLRVLGVLVLWLLSGALLMMGMLSPMGTANCDYEQHALCDESTLNLVMAIPAINAPLAALVGTWGCLSRRPGVAPVAWTSAVVLVIVAWVVTGTIAD